MIKISPMMEWLKFSYGLIKENLLMLRVSILLVYLKLKLPALKIVKGKYAKNQVLNLKRRKKKSPACFLD